MILCLTQETPLLPALYNGNAMPSLPAFVFCSGSFRASARFDVKSTLSLRSFRSLIQSKVCTEIYTQLMKKHETVYFTGNGTEVH